MKIAILHSFFDEFGGAEKVALLLARHLNADILTTNFNRKRINNFGFSDIKIKSIGTVSRYWPQKPFETTSLFKNADLNDYDLLIINSEWALAASDKEIPSIWYINSLPRKSYDNNRHDKIHSIPLSIIDTLIKKNIKKYLNSLNIIIANSNNTQRELIRNFKHDSILIYPPIETNKYVYKKPDNYWLSVNRIDYYKRIELQLKTFSLLPEQKLLIVGNHNGTTNSKNYLKYLKSIAPPNVSFIGEKYGNDLINLYSKCTGFFTTAKNEYFGITPLEAMASGKPVIAVDEGGYQETIDNTVGKLTKPKSYELAKAIKEILFNPKKYKNNCIDKAEEFSLEKFINHIDKVVKEFK